MQRIRLNPQMCCRAAVAVGYAAFGATEPELAGHPQMVQFLFTLQGALNMKRNKVLFLQFGDDDCAACVIWSICGV